MTGTLLNPETMQGIGIPLRGMSVWSAHTSADTVVMGDPQVGAATPANGQKSAAILETSGSQTAGGVLTVTTQKAGYSGPDGGGFRYHASTDATAKIGHDGPTLAGWNYIDRSSSNDKRHPAIQALGDGTILVVADDQGSGNIQALARYKMNATTGTWGASLGDPDSEATESASGYRRWPCIVELPPERVGDAGRVLLYSWVFDDNRSKMMIKGHYSDDSGVTWTAIGRSVIPAPISLAAPTSTRPYKISAAYKDGQVLLFASFRDDSTTNKTIMRQYASDDGGMSFSVVMTTDGAAASHGYPTVVVSGGYFVILYGSGNDLRSQRLSDAFSVFSESNYVLIDSSEMCYDAVGKEYTDEAALTAFVQEDGTIGLIWTTYDTSPTTGEGSLYLRYSLDYGETWPALADGNAVGSSRGYLIWHSGVGTSDQHPVHVSATWHRGRALLACGFVSSSNTWDASLNILAIGGYSSVTTPTRQRYNRTGNRTSWSRTWWAGALPEQVDATWTATFTGAATKVLDATGVIVTTALGENGFWVYDGPPGTAGEGLLVLIQGKHTSGTASFLLRVDNGTTDRWEITVKITTTAIQVVDNAGVELDIVSGIDTTSGYQCLFAMRTDAYRGWYRLGALAALNLPTRRWIQVGHDAAVPGAGASAGPHRIRFGAHPGVACVSTFQLYCWNSDEYNGVIEDIVADFDASKVYPRQYASVPIYVEDGVFVRFAGGASATGDAWTITARSSSPLARVLPDVSPSPRLGWKSANVAVDTDIAFRLADYADERDIQNDLAFLFLDECNITDFLLSKRRAGAWSTVSSITLGYELAYVMRGDTVVPATSGADTSRFLQRNELKGGSFQSSNGIIRKIASNTEGWWVTGAIAEKRPTLVLDGVDGTETTTGDGWIIFPRCLVIIHLSGTRDWEGIRLRIRQTGLGFAASPDGEHRIGVMAFGHILVAAQSPALGRAMTRDQRLQSEELPDGTPIRKRLGPSFRTIDVPFTDSRSQTQTRGNASNPAYTVFSDAAGAEPVAGWAETIQAIEGVLDEIDDGTPIVYIPLLERGDTGDTVRTYLENRCRGAIYGQIVGSFGWSNVAGKDEQTDAIRGTTLTIRELR